MFMMPIDFDNYRCYTVNYHTNYGGNISMKTSDKDRVDIVRRYSVGLERMKDLAIEYAMTRQGIYKILKQAGVNTSKGEGGSCRVTYSCTVCGTETSMTRSCFRKRKHVFCGEKCYFAWLKHGNGNPLIMHRQSGRQARKVVEKHFALRPSDIVHHEDRNQYNNHISNLIVFRNNGDHVRYHRGFEVPILWRGSIKGI